MNNTRAIHQKSEKIAKVQQQLADNPYREAPATGKVPVTASLNT